MKAILVIDVPIEMLNDNTCVIITSLHSGMSLNAKLKLMPERKDISDRKLTYEELKECYGWNACIDELEKC